MLLSRFLPLLLLLPASAHAVLGGMPEPLPASGKLIARAASRADAGNAYTVQQSTMSSGTVVREYVRGDGTVFAVTWEGPTMPELRRLFGDTYFSQYRQALPARRGSHGHFSVNNANLVARSVGHLRAFSGKAYVPQLLPQGVRVDELQ